MVLKNLCSKINDTTMSAFVEGTLDVRKRKRVQKHLQTCTECFENVARLRKSLAEREKLEFAPTPSEWAAEAKTLVVLKKGFLERVYDKLKSMVPTKSFWAGVINSIENILFGSRRWKVVTPVIIVAAVVLIFVFRPTSPIKNYSMGNQLIISETGPLGFVGEREVVKFEGMKVALSEDGKKLIFSWHDVEGAEFYHVYLILNGKKLRITPTLGINETSFSCQVQDIKLNIKYRWEITGKLEDGRGFEAKAGFVRRK